MLEIVNVSKSFNKTIKAVDNLNLTIHKGEIYGLLGPNGSGKTTTFRLILNLLFPDSGVVNWDGIHVSNKFLRKAGYVPEVVSLMKKFKVMEQLEYLGGLKGLSKKQVHAQWEKYCDLLEVREHKDKKIKALSKGNVQKIQILAGILHSPELLILDEPFSGLDVITTNSIKKLIMTLKEEGKSILFSSHRLDDIEEFCTSITILSRGSTIKQGKISDIRQSYGTNTIVYEAKSIDLIGLKAIKDIKFDVLSETNGIILCQTEKALKEVKKHILSCPTLTKFEVKMPTLSQIFIDLVEHFKAKGEKI